MQMRQEIQTRDLYLVSSVTVKDPYAAHAIMDAIDETLPDGQFTAITCDDRIVVREIVS